MDIDSDRQDASGALSGRDHAAHRLAGPAGWDGWDADRVAAGAGVAGLLSCVPQLPSALAGVLMALFIFLGPGNLVTRALPDVTPLTRRALVPVLGLSAMIVIAAASTMTGFYSPRIMLVVVALVVLVSGGVSAWRSTVARTA